MKEKLYKKVSWEDWQKQYPGKHYHEVYPDEPKGVDAYILVPVEDEWVSVDKINTVIKELELSLEPEQMVLDNPQKYHCLDVSQARLTHSSITACINIIKKILPQPPSQTNKPE